MAKDGTQRGGQRVGSGRKPSKKNTIEQPKLEVTDLPQPEMIEGIDMPPAREFLKREQKGGMPLCAMEIYEDTYRWLKARNCENLVNSTLVEQYAMSVARWIQCEEYISSYGQLAKHPTTGNPITSPYVTMSQSYEKQANQTWYQIYAIVRDNNAQGFADFSPQDDMMERLLRSKNS